jgi:phenylpropionate dioxygenase-like ring-hydroxylating dioxygenase large terminal subunit
MFVHRTWYWAAWTHEIKNKPLHRKYLNKDVVLFRDSKGTLQALSAVCPHRGANLAEGWIEGDCIRCPFHGLKFDSSGKCVEVPSQPPGERIPQTARVEAYPIREQDGVIWIWMDPAVELDHVPPHGEFFDPNNKDYAHQYWTREQKGDFAITLETALEDTHVPYIHKKTIRLPEYRMPKYKIEKFPNGRGFTAWYDKDSPWWVDTDLPPTKKLTQFAKSRIKSDSRAEFYMGAHVRQYFGGDAQAGIFITPRDDKSNWFAVTFSFPNKTLSNRIFNFVTRFGGLGFIGHGVFDEDEVFNSDFILTDRLGGLERPVFPIADTVCTEFRKMYRHFLLEEGREWGRSDVEQRRDAG